MPVVINEFEVVPEAPPAAEQAAQTEAPPPGPSAPEIERVVSHLAERAMRITAS